MHIYHSYLFKWPNNNKCTNTQGTQTVIILIVSTFLSIRSLIYPSLKVKFSLEQATKTQMGSRDKISTLSLTSALDGVHGQRHAPAALPPGKRPGSHCI